LRCLNWLAYKCVGRHRDFGAPIELDIVRAYPVMK